MKPKQHCRFTHFSGLLPAVLFFIFSAAPSARPELQITTVRLPLMEGMTRAELKHAPLPERCAGALVLCPGYNGDGEYLIREKGWREFAEKHRLLLVALSFASAEKDVSPLTRRGYYYVEKGSGRLLLDGIKKIANKELPLTLFGFSGGAHFTHRFVYKHPEKVRVWGAYGFGWFDEAPEKSRAKPPGIFVCGLKDERLPATRDAFLSALRARWRAAWLGVDGNGHSVEPRAVDAVRDFFTGVLSKPENTPGVWRKTSGNGLEGFWVRSWSPDEKTKKTGEAFQ
jgi:pimeloyl-ACP methyl ester carboxylesterase